MQDDRFADFVIECVERNRRLPYIRKDAKGRLAASLAHGRCRERMFEALFFLGRYELLNADAPKHRSATCVVLFARDHGEQLFPSGGGGSGGTEGRNEAEGSSGSDCVLKFMRNREQWVRELSARGGALEPESYGSSAVAASGGVLMQPDLHDKCKHPIAPATDAHKHPRMAAIDPRGHHVGQCCSCRAKLGMGGYRCTEGCQGRYFEGGDYCKTCVARVRKRLADGLRKQQLALQLFSPSNVMPVLRQHELSKEVAKALGVGLRDFPFVLVLPRGEEDLEGEDLRARFYLSLPTPIGLNSTPL